MHVTTKKALHVITLNHYNMCYYLVPKMLLAGLHIETLSFGCQGLIISRTFSSYRLKVHIACQIVFK